MTFITSSIQSGSSTTHTYSNVDIGTPSNNRIVVLESMTLYDSGTGHNPPSVTIDGSSVTARVNSVSDSPGVSITSTIYSKRITSGATANIVFTADSGSIIYSSIHVYAIESANEAPNTTASDNSPAGTLDQNINADDEFIGHCSVYDLSFAGLTWTGATEDSVENIAAVIISSSAMYAATATESPRSFSVSLDYTPGGSTGFASVGAVWTVIPGGKIKVWTGTEWASKPVKVWSGTAWVTKPVKYWNGTSWITK